MQVLKSSQGMIPDPNLPNRAAALRRYEEFLPLLPRYARERSIIFPDRLSVSRMSAYVRYRLIRESELVHKALDHYAYDDVSKFLDEVCWRTYWKGYLEYHSAIWTVYRNRLRELEETMPEIQRERLQQARDGVTGIECFDVWVRELTETGWLHNHVRMWFASIWIFTLRLPWELGASFFLQHLLDGDPASNTLSWRWVAGLHTPGKHYLARAENISRCTLGAFNPQGELNERAAPLLEETTFPEEPLPHATTLTGSLFPCLSLCPAGLVVLPEDLTPEIGEFSEMPFSSICVFNASDVMDSFGATRRVRSFVNGAVSDTATRLAAHWGGQELWVDGTVQNRHNRAQPANVGCWEHPRVYSGNVHNWVDSILRWATNENLNSISLLQPPTGPWQDMMPELRAALKARNIHLVEFRRRWDVVHWPHASRGYFAFRKGLRDRLLKLSGEGFRAKAP